MEIKRILLLAPPAFTFKSGRDVNPLPPMGLGYLASTLAPLGLEIKIIDCLVRGWDREEEVSDKLVRIGLSDEAITEAIIDFNPDLIGLNCQFSRQFSIYHNLLSLIKKINHEIITVCGGAHVTVCPKEVLADDNCDFIIIGEGELSFKKFVQGLQANEEVTTVDGLGWKKNGELHINEKKEWITDLDSIPFPAYHLMNLELYFGLSSSHGIRHKKRFSPIITSRGCPSKCTFCSAHRVWGNLHRKRSVDNVLEEMRLLKNTYGIEELMFEDDNVTADPKRAKELFSRMIEENFGFIWDTPNGVGAWTLTNETLELMKESGCVQINFPVESGSQKVLKEIVRKPLNLQKVKQLIAHCNKIGLDYGMFLVIGMPGETIADIWQSFKFAAECGCYNPHISIATPYPGTKLFDKCLEEQLFSREFNLSQLFIRSYLIKTEHWDEKTLKKVLIQGRFYLFYKSIVDSPVKTFSMYFQMVKRKIKKIVNRKLFNRSI